MLMGFYTGSSLKRYQTGFQEKCVLIEIESCSKLTSSPLRHFLTLSVDYVRIIVIIFNMPADIYVTESGFQSYFLPLTILSTFYNIYIYAKN